MNIINNIKGWGYKIGYWNYISRMIYRQINKRIFKRTLSLRLKNGLLLRLPIWSGFAAVAWVTNGTADDGCEEVVELFANKNSEFYDVGAHFGYWALRVAHESSRVIAFEPNPICQKDLRYNLATVNHLVVSKAVSDQEGDLEFLADSSAPHSALITPGETNQRKGSRIKVPVTTLDATWQSNGNKLVWGIKIDTEGHEASVVRGGLQMTKASHPIILIEASSKSVIEISEILQPLDYFYGWLSQRKVNHQQILYIAEMDTAQKTFKEGMLFAFPRNKTELLSNINLEIKKIF